MKFIRCFLFSLFAVSVIGCTETNALKGDHSDTSINNSSDSIQVISGVVINEIKQGRDGSTWKFKGDDGQTYSLLISIPNLGQEQSENIYLVKPNTHLEIKGEIVRIGNEKRLIARQIKH